MMTHNLGDVILLGPLATRVEVGLNGALTGANATVTVTV